MFSFLSFFGGGGITLFSLCSFHWKCLSCTLQCDSWSSKINFIIDITTQYRGSHDVRDAATIYNLTSISSPPHLSPSPEVRTFLTQKKTAAKDNWYQDIDKILCIFRMNFFQMFASALTKESLAITYSCVGWSVSGAFGFPNGLNVSKSVQKCPMCPKVLSKRIHHLSDIISLNFTF